MCFALVGVGLAYLGSALSAMGAAGAGAAITSVATSSILAGAGTGIAGTAVTAGGLASSAAAAASLIGTGVSMAGQAQAAKAQTAANEYNAEVARVSALDAERRGSMAEAEHRTQSKRIIGQMMAESGTSGVVGSTGSGADVFAETAEYGARSAAAARISGGREAFGYRSQADIDAYSGRTASALVGGRIAGTALSGAASVFKQNNPWWTTWKNKPDYTDWESNIT